MPCFLFSTDADRIIWFLTFSTKKRKIMFENKEECSEIIKLIDEACERNSFNLHEAVVMEDHVHLVLDTDKKIEVSKILKNIKGFCAKKFLEKFEYYCENSKGRHLWTPKAEYEIIKDQKRYDEIFNYVQRNPEKDGFKKENRLFSEFVKFYDDKSEIKVFTTRPDTLFGCTYMAVAPEHKILEENKENINNWDEVESYVKQANKKTEMERGELSKEKTGVEIRGLRAVNPVNNEEIPIFVADYVMMSYGAGAIMCVPAHDERDFEFAKKHDLPIREVVEGGKEKKCFSGEGSYVNSAFLDGLETKEAKKKMIVWLEEKRLGKRAVNYKLKDWVFSRQRYWGEPIPIVHCEKCGNLAVPEKDLPVKLPDVKNYEPTGTGESPLANIAKWVNVKCPQCKGKAKRETNTMPQWGGSSWYYLRYIDPKNKKELVDKKKEKYWSPVDFYVGGAEHATRHLIYARFWHKFLYDIGAVSHDEPFLKLRHVGLVVAEDGRKMSKRWGNVINPDTVVESHGADAMRVYEMFMGPFAQACAWSTSGLSGARKFLEKVYNLSGSVKKEVECKKETQALLHKTIKKVSDDIVEFKFNTAVSAMMIFVNKLSEEKEISLEVYETFLKILAPFAPHVTEEIWDTLGHKKSIFKEEWPKYDPEIARDEKINLVVQVNGKVRDSIEVDADILEEDAKKIVLESEKIKKWTENKEIKKIFYIKGRLVSVVAE
ncbi:MAG: leucine--tRNA ligase [bacterium]